MPRVILLIAVLGLAGCTKFPSLSERVSEESLDARYPKLIALSQEDVAQTETTGAEVIEELDGRTASLWERIGLLFY